MTASPQFGVKPFSFDRTFSFVVRTFSSVAMVVKEYVELENLANNGVERLPQGPQESRKDHINHTSPNDGSPGQHYGPRFL